MRLAESSFTRCVINGYTLGCVALERRIKAGEVGAAIEAERERLSAQWAAMTGEERAAVERAIADCVGAAVMPSPSAS